MAGVEFQVFEGVSCDLRPWISKLEDQFACDDYSDMNKLALAVYLLGGKAESFVHQREEIKYFETWDELKSSLIRMFGERDDPERIRLQTERDVSTHNWLVALKVRKADVIQEMTMPNPAVSESQVQSLSVSAIHIRDESDLTTKMESTGLTLDVDVNSEDPEQIESLVNEAGIPEVIDVEHYEFRNANLVDKKNKGKAIQDGSLYDHLADEEVVMSTTQPWGFPSSSSKRSRRSSSASSSRPRAAVEVVVSSAQANFLRDFKRFDTVDNFSKHHYASQGNASKQHSRTWVKKIQADWKILENDLPETISVRACESRMDLLRAVIVGAEGTPYHEGLFFFDIHFPDTYPSVPPMVHYHSGGLRINPNLYNCGKVCLSLLGTWNGNAREKWLPQESTMLQLLVSIQALILNQKPYFNEPAYERTKGTPSGEAHSKFYSENVYVLSLRTMVYSMRKPPKHFEEFVRSHYFERAHDIVKASNAYIDGAPVGSIVKGGVQDIEESSENGSMKFRTEVATFMKTVVEELVKLGVKELEDKLKPPPNAEGSNKSNCKRSISSR